MEKNSLYRQGFKSRFHNGTGFSLFIVLILLGLLFLLFIHKQDILAAGMKDENKTEYIIVLDPGHGGENMGTIENGYCEKEMTLRTALAMEETLNHYENITVYLTRRDDVDLSLSERAEYAKSVDGDFLISLHYNASLSHNIYGTELWVNFNAPYQAYGVEFGKLWLEEVSKTGVFVRGVKSRESENNPGTDYYGILRNSGELEIPAVILEHAHVDEDRDTIYLDTEEKQIAFGVADAHALARFLGLPLKPEYQGLEEAFDVDNPVVKNLDENKTYFQVVNQWTPPEVCTIEKVSEDYEKGEAIIQVNAADYDTVLLYYSYSVDGGRNFSKLYPWPEADTVNQTYKDSFRLTIPLPDNKFTRIVVRAHNMFDQYTESNILEDYKVYHAPKEEDEVKVDYSENLGQEEVSPVISDGVILNNVTEEKPGWSFDNLLSEGASKLIGFLLISLFVAISIIWLIVMLVLNQKHRKKRRNKNRNKRK